MNPALLAIIIQALIKYGPVVVASIVEKFHTENPTVEQWQAIFSSADKSYDDYVKAKEGQ